MWKAHTTCANAVDSKPNVLSVIFLPEMLPRDACNPSHGEPVKTKANRRREYLSTEIKSFQWTQCFQRSDEEAIAADVTGFGNEHNRTGSKL